MKSQKTLNIIKSNKELCAENIYLYAHIYAPKPPHLRLDLLLLLLLLLIYMWPLNFAPHLHHIPRTSKKMNGYSRIRLINSTKSRPMDFSDLLSSPDNQTSEPIKETAPNPHSKSQNTKSNGHNNNPTSEPEEYAHQTEDDDDGETFGEVLRRSCSVSSAGASHSRFIRFDKQLGSSVKRAFSMRRSSSVSERYSRIHDQCVTTLGVGPTSFDDPDENNEVSMKKKKKKQHRTGRMLKACKRIFGLQS